MNPPVAGTSFGLDQRDNFWEAARPADLPPLATAALADLE
jgi:hypothetical protein